MEVSGRAFVYSERWSDATKWLKEAVDLDEDSFPILRINALIALSEALSHTVDAASAIPPCERAVKIAKLLPGAMEITLAHALGENAIASWYAGDRKSAYSLIEECVNRILKCKEDKTIWKKTFTVTGYVCSYFSVMARYGKLPEGMTEAEPPRRGVFNDIDPSMAELYESDKEWLIAAQLATFAAALGEDQGAATWALRAVEMGRTAAGGEISGMVKRFALTQAILDQRYLDALELAVGAMAALVSSVTRSQVQLPPTLLPPKSLTELSASDLEARSIETVLFMGLVPIAFGLATIWLDDAGSAAEVATSMATRCRELAEDTDSPDRWNQAADVVVRAFNTGASMDELKELGEKFVSISASLQITCYLGAMLRARPEHAIKVQLTIIPLLESRLGNEGAYRRVVVPFLRRFWENKLEQSPFYFQAPQRTLGVVKGTKITPANLAVRQLFEEVSRSLGYTPDADERRWLNNASSVSSAGNN
jgi:hypothetical protein